MIAGFAAGSNARGGGKSNTIVDPDPAGDKSVRSGLAGALLVATVPGRLADNRIKLS